MINLQILFKQRVFTHCFRKLMNGAESVDIRQPELQVNYLLALIHVLQNIPSQVATNELHKVSIFRIFNQNSAHILLL